MGWHQVPDDDGWTRVTLASIHALDRSIWIRCNACCRSMDVPPLDFAAQHNLDPSTPLLLIERRLRCTVCGERKAHCWPTPFNSLKQ